MRCYHTIGKIKINKHYFYFKKVINHSTITPKSLEIQVFQLNNGLIKNKDMLRVKLPH